MVKETSASEIVVGLSSFLIFWILDTVSMVLLFFQFKIKMAVYAVCKKENICTTFDTILRRFSFILMFFQDLTFLLSVGNPFSGDLEV